MTRTLPTLIALVLVAALAFWAGRAGAPEGGVAPEAAPILAETWTCPMHPSVVLPEPVPCPICGMDLVPFDGAAEVDGSRLELSAGAAALAGVRTAPVERGPARRPVRLVGRLERDETTLRTVSANVPGRLERLFVDRVGVEVTAGEHLFEIYSPALYSAQAELVQVVERIAARGGNTGAFFDETLERSYRSARDKLVLYGLDESQLDALEASRDPHQRIEFRSPVNGTVVARHVEQGDFVIVGTPIFELANLDDLWLELEAHEQDLPWLVWGQEVVATFEGLPGEVVRGKVSFLDPELDPASRTVSLRMHVHDTRGRLRPGMFARATVLAELDARGEALRPDVAGLWVSPMHPEVVSDRPGQCTVCGMDLVPAESLGLEGRPSAGTPLLVPETAVLWTGTRSVVYVEDPQAPSPTYVLREVTLGPRAGDRFVVLEGLVDGERVVVEGAFRVDSAMQIRGRRSMLSMPAEPGPGAGPDGAAFRARVAPAVDASVAFGAALAADDEGAAALAVDDLLRAAEALEPGLLPARAAREGEALVAALRDSARVAARAAGLEAQRRAFEPVSAALWALVERFGVPGAASLVRVHCPMAFDDRGADWVQRGDVIANPYFGASMLRCGAIEARLSGSDPAQRAPEPADGEATSGRDTTRKSVGGATEGAVRDRTGDRGLGGRSSDAAASPGGADTERASAAEHARVWGALLDASRALAADELNAARAALIALGAEARAAALSDRASAAPLEALADAAAAAGVGLDLAALRAGFEAVSDAARALLDAAGNRSGTVLRVAFCPMAFENRGARWVQADGVLANPYFGASMLRCGGFEREVDPR